MGRPDKSAEALGCRSEDDSAATDRDIPLAALEAARGGSSQAVGALLDNCRNYLLLVANASLGTGLKAKVGASDLVQETFLEAQRTFDRFTGNSEPELLRWLTRILEHKLGNTFKRYCWADKRLITREIALDSGAGVDSQRASALVGSGESPSGILSAREEEHRLHAAIAELPADYRQAIELRCREDLSFAEMGQRMYRSADAARMLFARAVDLLEERMRDNDRQSD